METSFFYRDPGAPRPNRPRTIAVTALIEDEGRLLFDRRSDAPKWGLIGGRVELDESLTQALRREIAEETGLEVESSALFGTFSDPSRVIAYGDGNVVQPVTVAYSVQVRDVGALRLSSESTAFAWWRLDEVPLDEVVAVHVPILERLAGPGTPPFLD